MTELAEGVEGYPRWDGALNPGSTVPAMIAQELRRAWYNQWVKSVLILIVGYSVIYMTSLYTQSQARGDAIHTWSAFFNLMGYVPWGALALAAIAGGPAYLDDSRQGALELYMSRAVTHRDYLLAKGAAVFGMAFLAAFMPAIVYYGSAFLIFENHPEGWNLVPAGALAFSLMWAILATGLALGLSCIARSSRAATLILLGAFALVDALISNILTSITNNDVMQILSPMSAIAQQREWMFGQPGEFGFPYWWGLVVWGGLSVIGWTLVALRHPRLRGDERGA